jgi:hypothetical protein
MIFDQFRRDFFPDTERHTLHFDITSDDWQTIQYLTAENEWGPDEGLRHLLAIGVAYVQGHLEIAAISHPDADLAAEVKRLQAERMSVESRYAVMKFRAYSAMQAAQLLEMKLNACKQEVDMLRKANELLRQGPDTI